MRTAVAIISKLPREGHSKTRLARTLGGPAALALHRAFLHDQRQALQQGDWDLFLLHDAPKDAAAIAERDALISDRLRSLVVGGAGLQQELWFGLRALLADYDRVAIVSGDVPQISAQLVADALDQLDAVDLVLGPGPDGGYWLLAARTPVDVFTTVAMGGGPVVHATMALAKRRGLSVALAASLDDIDEAQDLRALELLPPQRAPHTRAVMAGLGRTPHALGLPHELQVEVSARCNLRCGACILAHAAPGPTTDLSLADFLHDTAELPLERVVFQLNGESMLNEDLWPMIRQMADRGVETLLNSNGTLLDVRRCQALLDSGLDVLRVSLDGADAATVQRVTGADSFDRVVAGLRRLVALRGAGPRPQIGLWMLALRDTIAALPKLVELAAELGVEEVYLQRVVLTGHGLATPAHSLHGAVDAPARDAILLAESRAKELGISLRASGRRPPLEMLAASSADNPRLGCWRPWRSAVLTADRRVMPCCLSTFTTPYDQLARGDRRRQSWQEIWDGPAYRALRRGILSGEPAPPCVGCGEAWSL